LAGFESTAARNERAGTGRQVLLSLVFATFLVNGSATFVAPFLLEIAEDLGSELVAAGHLVAITSLTWGARSLLADAASDRIDRKPILLLGLVLLTASPIGVALAGSYLLTLP
jgi:predicted MFS family arabinose efflux permease